MAELASERLSVRILPPAAGSATVIWNVFGIYKEFRARI